MGTHVARIEWDAVHVPSGAAESGESLILLEEVVISRRPILRMKELLMERIRALGVGIPSREKMMEISREVMKDPGANEVVGAFYVKSLRLSENYSFSYTESLEEDLRGFGLMADIGPIEPPREGCKTTFSWDWFNVVAEAKAHKLQESGVLSFERAKTPLGWEITRLRFDTDVSLRIARSGAADPRNPEWRVNIHSGSEVLWPSLVDDKLIACGYLE